MPVTGAGLEGIVATESRLCFIDGDAGLLSYQGFRIEALAENATFEEVIYLLWHGRLPKQAELDELKAELVANRPIPADVEAFLKSVPKASPMHVLRTAVSMLALADSDPNNVQAGPAAQKAAKLMAQTATIVTSFDRLRKGQPVVAGDSKLGFAANFLYTLTGKKPDDVMAHAFDVALILHAEHELNASTFAARVTAATLSDIYSAVTAAIGALRGPLHGGANEDVIKLLLEAGTQDKALQMIKDKLANKVKIPGFGHRVYHTVDPRAASLKGMAEELGKRTGHEELYLISREIEKYIKEAKNLNANVDFYSASTYYSLGIPVDLFTPIFAVSRMSGWTAHILEQYANNRLIRPRAEYLGPAVGQKWVQPAQLGPSVYDLWYFRNNLDAIAKRLADRGFTLDVATFRSMDEERRKGQTILEKLLAQRNAASQEIGKLMKAGEDASEPREAMRKLGERISELEQAAREVDGVFRDKLAGIPNTPHESVPAGKSAADNVEVRRWGTPPQFTFTAKPHWDLGPELGILDFDRAAKITGARFAVYMGLGAKLERALINFMLDVHTKEHGYTEVLPPFVANKDSFYGTGQLPKFEQDLFKLEGTDYYLIPTAEVPVTNLYRSETLDLEKLPIKLTAYTPCFRSEAGSYGRDVRGIIRQHQFQKVELVKFARPESSYEELESLTRDAEDILQRLGLAYRTVVLSTGDIGFSSAKTYDIEVWLPGLNDYKEISSCSNFEAFQARRASIRAKSAKGKAEFVHTLNGSGLAVGRTWLAIIENYQQADGSVVVPEALRPYMGVDVIRPAQ